MSRSLFVMIVILGRKRWGVRGGAIIEIATGKSVQVTWFVEQSVFLFNAAISLTAEANGVTVTRFGSVTPGKRKTKAR